MSKLFPQFLVLSVILTFNTIATAAGDDDSSILSQVSGYRQWTRVNSEPVKVQVPVTIDPALAVD